jgi:hypothetical protein
MAARAGQSTPKNRRATANQLGCGRLRKGKVRVTREIVETKTRVAQVLQCDAVGCANYRLPSMAPENWGRFTAHGALEWCEEHTEKALEALEAAGLVRATTVEITHESAPRTDPSVPAGATPNP